MMRTIFVLAFFIIQISCQSSTEQCLTCGNRQEFCEGKLSLLPLSRSMETASYQRVKRFRIPRNRHRNGIAIHYITVESGTCCWRTCDRYQNCDTFSAGEEKRPSSQFIHRIE